MPGLGLSIATRTFGTAVARNRIKRLARESFRLNQHSLPPVDVTVSARDGARAATRRELRLSLDQHWKSHAEMITPRQLLMWIIRGYQLVVSPMLGPRCRFYPSVFLLRAYRHRALRGAARRLARPQARCCAATRSGKAATTPCRTRGRPMPNIRLMLWGVLAAILFLNYQTWMHDYEPPASAAAGANPFRQRARRRRRREHLGRRRCRKLRPQRRPAAPPAAAPRHPLPRRHRPERRPRPPRKHRPCRSMSLPTCSTSSSISRAANSIRPI